MAAGRARPRRSASGGDRRRAPRPARRGGRRRRAGGWARAAPVRAPPTPGPSASTRCSISTNRPESGSVVQAVLAVVWTRISQPLPRGAPVTSGVPSDRRGQGRRREVGAGLGQHLAADADLVGDRQAGERAVGRERGERQRLGPGQGAAQHAVAGAQADRDQIVAARRRAWGRRSAAARRPARSSCRAGALLGVEAGRYRP